MLTFFEYLRRRAYESIVGGVYDALANLDQDALPEPLQEPAAAQPAPLSEPRKLNEPAAATGPSPATVPEPMPPTGPTDNSRPLPAPRRRGRPPKKRAP